ncbi:alpha/beta fold hydrolase [Vibrio methylphosphonaticus]|uniref:alpha/beta fold hydrolase n=1 Tax=Vibrio methylphosphonaticus TaxID=2946866 RepID=UPI00202A6857|nr:alpha/beta fold hydrolase [Vibrio methylphosphonaticus]MCL9775087.1 alpha/beta hydrolase [Vibrio methylphosphonaticus]
MKQFSIDGQMMAYQDIGSGPVVIFGHSYLWDSKMWAPQIEVLSQHYRCIVPDFWSHGESESAPASMRNLTHYAEHILALMDELKIATFSVVGLSVGGMWGAELTALAPSRVKSLVMMDTFVGLEPEVMHTKYFAMLDTITQVRAVPEPILEAVVPMFFAQDAKNTTPELVDTFATKLSNVQGDKAVEIARIGRMVFGRRDLCDELEKFALPTLIAVGAEDKPRPVLESYLMQDLVSGSELMVIPAAGHISNLEQPELVTSKLTEFLTQYA